MQLYPSYQLPPQVRALAGRSVGAGGPMTNDTYLHSPPGAHSGGGGYANSMAQVPPQDGAPQAVQDVAAAYNQQAQLNAAQQAAVSGAGPGVMPAADAVARQQFLAGASAGLDERGLRATPPPPGTPQYANLPPQIAALANSYGAPQVQGVQQPGADAPPAQPVRPDPSNLAGFRGGYRRALVR